MSKFHEIKASMKGRYATKKKLVGPIYTVTTDDPNVFALQHITRGREGALSIGTLTSDGKLCLHADTGWITTNVVSLLGLFEAFSVPFFLVYSSDVAGIAWTREDDSAGVHAVVKYCPGDYIDLHAGYLHAKYRI